MADRSEKLLVGPRIKRLRQTLGLTQAQMADDLSVSASYINLIERNQRPISAKVMLKLAQIYDLDVAELASSTDVQTIAELHEVLRDPALGVGAIGKNEVEDLVNVSPDIARAFLRLYEKNREHNLRAWSDENPLADREKVEVLEQSARSVEQVRVWFHQNKNYFQDLDVAAETLSAEMGLSSRELHTPLADRLHDRHALKVRIVPVDVMPSKLRYYDRHRGGMDLSELLPQSGRRFQMAVQLALLEYADRIDALVKESGLTDRNAIGLARTSLANYFAAALLMPYHRFLKECEATKYDIELMSARFGTSYEQTAHRMTTLQKPDARGIPFFFVRMDAAGNVSKRFSAGRFHFSKFGGACPLWNIHNCFETPGKVRTQIIRMPDETTYFSISRTVSRIDGTYDHPPTKLAIGLGCDIAYAPRLAYAREHNMDDQQPTKIGVNCYLCERQNCPSRAHAPLNKKLIFDERSRGVSIFHFEDV